MTKPSPTFFERNVRAAFGFLVDKHGYTSHVDEADGAVVFHRGKLLIRVFCESDSCMIYVDICRQDTGEAYLLHEVLHAIAPDEVLSPQCSGADSAKMERCLNQLSQLCQKHLHGVLAMDARTFEVIAESAIESRRRYTLDAKYRALTTRANLAWERKEWEEAQRLYEAARPGLSAIEQRRLEFLGKKFRRT